jgi:hypothetical protein
MAMTRGRPALSPCGVMASHEPSAKPRLDRDAPDGHAHVAARHAVAADVARLLGPGPAHRRVDELPVDLAPGVDEPDAPPAGTPPAGPAWALAACGPTCATATATVGSSAMPSGRRSANGVRGEARWRIRSPRSGSCERVARRVAARVATRPPEREACRGVVRDAAPGRPTRPGGSGRPWSIRRSATPARSGWPCGSRRWS